jgi:thiamine-phosphate pyrophosphorylase
VKAVDVRLNAIVDPARAGGHDIVELARRVAEGGATLVQLRDKGSETRAIIEKARAIKAALSPFKVAFVVNDRVDVALAAHADGVHLGSDDMAVIDARALLGPNAIIGLSIKTIDEAANAPIEHFDYAGVGGVYATLSKEQKTAPIGTEGFAHVADALRNRARNTPIVGIAGIDSSNVGAVIAAGADGVAVISALSTVQDPAAAARALRQLVDVALAKRLAPR